jgi:hypothetical protein
VQPKQYLAHQGNREANGKNKAEPMASGKIGMPDSNKNRRPRRNTNAYEIVGGHKARKVDYAHRSLLLLFGKMLINISQYCGLGRS